MSDCRHLKPKICGNKLKPFLSDKGCGVPRFVGIEDVTINQGIGIDLTEGVYAYDGNGNEIEYTVTPDSIDMCDVGEHTVIYRAMAEGKKFAPWFCSKQRGLAGDLLCNRVALRKDRTVTIEQIDPPRIEGLDTVKISPNVEFDPTEGVTAIDGNGNVIEYSYEPQITEFQDIGEYVITYTATDVCGNTTEVDRSILVGVTAIACESQACGAFVYCAPTEACEAIVGLSATACE